ncbi:MAG: hypothetical protein AB1898_30640 [Acidobacteriota bacterium]
MSTHVSSSPLLSCASAVVPSALGRRRRVLDEVNGSRGKSGGWPDCFEYGHDGDYLTVTMRKGYGKKEFRRFDAWALAFLNEFEKKTASRAKGIKFHILGASPESRYNLEAFVRRVSYLQLCNHDRAFSIQGTGGSILLYDSQTLFERPPDEVVRNDVTPRSDDDKPGRIEKDFQTFLFGKNLDRPERTNERLAVLGMDFFQLGKRNLGILREFPTGAFRGKVAGAYRVLPTEFVDIVTLNKHRELSVIELKINDSQLEVISQILDYALFFACYIDQLYPTVRSQLAVDPKPGPFVCYVVNNHFHERFDEVLRHYRTPPDIKFHLKKVVLGYTQMFQSRSANGI